VKTLNLTYIGIYTTSIEVDDDYELTSEALREIAHETYTDFNDGSASWDLSLVESNGIIYEVD